ncbi:hypothetical protein [Clostridium botulinum]|uniref:hypothetical protein n=1 Tax=Clostridium botulinum TaxID=1491 RepID=UPI00249F7FA7|nr:hypothetical protein [Clostridium botulinum]MDU4596467.1 hypothetical protein [Clostridium sporogenes]WGZ48101.1 hypothetical protein HEQ52_18315 [Clostridium botulinum]
MKLVVGTIKQDCKEDLRVLEGIQFLALQDDEFFEELSLIYPIKYEKIEKFYKFGFDTFGKNEIDDDFNYFVWYMLNGDCELIPTVKLDQLEDVRQATKEEDYEAYVNIEKFKFNHKFYDKEVNYQEVKITKVLIDNIIRIINSSLIPFNKNRKLESLKCFEFDSGEKDFIIADCFNSAMKYYIDMIGEEILIEEEYSVKEVEEWEELKLKNEEDDGTFKEMTFLESVKDSYENGYDEPIYLATTCV